MTSGARSRPSTATSRRGGGACRSRSEAGLPETIVNALTVDVEEYYHGYEFEAALGVDGLRRLPSRVLPQTERLLDLLDTHRARGTFFVLGVVAQRYPRLVREIVERGHEIASHGWDHTPVFRLGPAGFRADVRRAKHAVEQAAGRLVRGYRAPNYSIRRDTPWAFSVLVEEGFVYDSSMYPVVHDRYGFPDAPRFPHVAQHVEGIDFWEVPVGTARFAGVTRPLGSRRGPRSHAPLVRGATAGRGMSAPFVVGVAGGSGSGKTALCRALAGALGPAGVAILCHDAYYRDRSDLPAAERAALNYDVPDALDTPLVLEHLRALRAGLPARA